MTWDVRRHAPGSTLLVFATLDGFVSSLERKPNVWSRAVRRGAEAAGRWGTACIRKQQSDVGNGAQEETPPKPRPPVAVLLMRPDELSPGDPAEDQGAKMLYGLMQTLTGMQAVRVSSLPGSPDWDALPGPVGLLLMSASMAAPALERLATQATPRAKEAPVAGGRLLDGCIFAVLELPTGGMMSVFDGEPTYCAFGFEKTKDEKDVLSLRTWETFQEELTEEQRQGELLGVGVHPTGCLVFYPDGWFEALQMPCVQLKAGPQIGETTKKWEVFDDDENAFALPRGFAPHASPVTVVADWVVEGGGLAFTGAGISKESGVPTFRDGDGLWQRYDAMEVSSIGGLAGEPAKVWAFEREFNDILARCKGPNPGHVALAEMEAAGCVDLLVTQNVDGFHQAAGSKEVLELHGSEVHAICLNKPCGHRIEMKTIFETSETLDPAADGSIWSPLAKGWGVRWPERPEDTPLQRSVREQLAVLQRPPKKKRKRAAAAGGSTADAKPQGATVGGSSGSKSPAASSDTASDDDSSDGSSSSGSSASQSSEEARKKISKACAARPLSKEEEERGPPECRVPLCPRCRTGILKPDGIYFGETLERKILERSVRQSEKSRVVLMVGTSGTVDPAARLPLIAKKKNGAKIVEVNIKDTRLSKVADIRLRGQSASVLPRVQRLVAAHPRLAELQAQRAEKVRRAANTASSPAATAAAPKSG